jgi:hypothetical protein
MSTSGIPITIREDLFYRLQARARPLVDDVNAVLERLLDEGERVSPGESRGRRRFVTLARGERLPVGLKLRAVFQQREFRAEVTDAGIGFEGQVYRSPSAAARAAKRLAGVPEMASHANGWLFWDYLDEVLGCYSRLEDRRDGDWEESVPRTTRRRGLAKLRSIGSGASGTHDTSVRAGDERPVPRSWL